MAYLSEFAGPENPFAQNGPAIVTDISDFYQRIYFRRIENVLQDAGCRKGPADLVKKIIKTTRAKELARSSRARLQDVFTSAELEKMQAFITLNYGDDDGSQDQDTVTNPFVSAEFLLNRLDEIGDKKGVDLSVFKALLRALRFSCGIDAERLLGKHADLLYYVPREFCLTLSAASKQDDFAGELIKGRVIELLAMSPYSDLAYVRSWLLNLFVDETLPVSLSDWQFYDFNRSVIERRSHLFFHGLANNRAYFRALKTQLGSLSEWDKPAALMAGMCLPYDEYKSWLAVAVQQLSTPFASTYVAWLTDNHGKLRQLLSKPHAPVCTSL